MKQQAHNRSVRRTLREDTRGAGFVEYIILVGLIALIALSGFGTFGDFVNKKAAALGLKVSEIGNAPGSGGGGSN